jgi:hypothetical protein
LQLSELMKGVPFDASELASTGLDAQFLATMMI